MLRQKPPPGVPETMYFKGHMWSFECMTKLGEPIYARSDHSRGNVHAVNVNPKYRRGRRE